MLNEISRLSVPERILLVRAVWDSIALESENVQLDSGQKKIIADRLESYKKNPENVPTWNQIKSSLPK